MRCGMLYSNASRGTRSSGLRCCWLLQDALLDEKAQTSAFGDGLFRAAWAASQQSESCGETAAFVGALVRLSNGLAKVERTKRRQPERLWPLLHALERLAGAASVARRRRRPIATGIVVVITTSFEARRRAVSRHAFTRESTDTAILRGYM